VIAALLLGAFAAEPPEGWRDVAGLRNVELDVRYATAENFTGRVLDGYTEAGAWLRDVPFAGLEKAAETARQRGYTLIVFDAYRPERASRDMVAWAEETQRTDLLRDGYVAARSGHNKGHTIDLTLKGIHGPLDMGTPYDTFSEAAHTQNATGIVAANRKALLEIMEAGGFRNYSKEWWHFSHGSGPYDPLDVPYGERTSE
jgi:D-alanyl-D-alanine dipeptidase